MKLPKFHKIVEKTSEEIKQRVSDQMDALEIINHLINMIDAEKELITKLKKYNDKATVNFLLDSELRIVELMEAMDEYHGYINDMSNS